MRSRWAILVAVIAVLAVAATPGAFAADAEDVASVVADTGVYVEVGASADTARVGELVSAIRSEGERINFVALSDEPIGGATTFADAVYDRLGEGVVVVVSPLSVGWSGTTEVFTDAELDAAVDAGLDAETDGDVLELFTETLLGASVPGAPATTSPATAQPEPAASSSGGGSSVLIWVVVIAAGVGLFLFWRSRQNKTKGPRLDPRLAEAKQAVQKQIDALANDIIDMEDEVRVADNEQADDYYEKAGITYGEVTDAFATATTAEAVLGLSNQLDVAIWQLDCAEAVLDGKPLPPRTEPKRLPAPEPAAPAGVPQPAPSGSSTLPPRPDYSRRSTRRSSPMGGGLLEMLIGVGTIMAGRSRGGVGGMLGGLGRSSRGTRVPAPSFPQVPSRSSRSGAPVPGPSSSRSSTSSSRSSRSSGRSGSTGRGRGGGRRRRG